VYNPLDRRSLLRGGLGERAPKPQKSKGRNQPPVALPTKECVSVLGGIARGCPKKRGETIKKITGNKAPNNKGPGAKTVREKKTPGTEIFPRKKPLGILRPYQRWGGGGLEFIGTEKVTNRTKPTEKEAQKPGEPPPNNLEPIEKKKRFIQKGNKKGKHVKKKM